jgi:hypothetical protein
MPAKVGDAAGQDPSPPAADALRAHFGREGSWKAQARIIHKASDSRSAHPEGHHRSRADLGQLLKFDFVLADLVINNLEA